MPLSPGTRLGPYEIVATAGAGGMGEVYRARDTRLDRTVAIKVLPSQFAADPELRARFDREARAVSSLNHPHICALYDIGSEAGTDFLVLEFLEGETLAARLARTGALPPNDALKIAIEICGALDRAHRAGIVHRDLKPANVMLTKAGAKLLDFGLAKTAAPVVAVSGLSMMPTTPHGVTAQGTILGTFQYMAPEQIEGLEADVRTDIFAFGALLFEMLTGRAAFEGKTRASLLGAILKDEPPRVSDVQPVAPATLDRVVSTCLAKDPDDRYQSARDLLRDLQWIASGAGSAAVVPAAAAVLPPSRAPWLVAGALAIALLASTAVVVRHVRETPAAAEPAQFTFAPPPGATFATPPGGGTGLASQIAISPDGRSVIFVGTSQNGIQLWLRPIAGVDARAIAGTQDAAFPFWSPDSRQIGFFASGKLKKVTIAGGPPVVLCDATSGRGGTWNADNVIVFSPSTTNVLQRVPAAGGIPQAASAFNASYGETSHRFPSFLPDGRHFVFSAVTGTCCPPPKPGTLRIGTLDSTEATTLLQIESSAAIASGHLLFAREGTLMAQAFDMSSRRLNGDAFPIAEHVGSEGSRYGSFSASLNGTLVYARGVARPTSQLTWMDRAGRRLQALGEPAIYLNFALSSDERRIAVAFAAGTENRDIWILDTVRGSQRRLTFDPADDTAPVWSSDDSRIVFQGNRAGSPTLREKRVDGTTTEETLMEVASGGLTPTDWSPDGRYALLTRTMMTAGSSDIWALPLFGDRKPFPLVQTPFTDTAAAFSPDGRWFAYSSVEGGTTQIFVQPFPVTGAKFQVSRNGGYQPLWRRDGKELFFISQDGRLMAAAVETAAAFQSGVPAALFAVSTVATQSNPGRQYAVTRDGSRFLVNVVQQDSATMPLTVVVNWLATVQR